MINVDKLEIYLYVGGIIRNSLEFALYADELKLGSREYTFKENIHLNILQETIKLTINLTSQSFKWHKQLETHAIEAGMGSAY